MQIFFQVFPLGWLQEIVIGPHLPLASELQLRSPQLKCADYNPAGCAIVLENHFSIVLQSNFKLKHHWRQQPVGQTFQEGVSVQRDDGLYCHAVLGQKRPLPHSGVRRIVCSHCGGVRVKIPKLTFGHASRKIVREVQQVFDENRLVDAVGVVKHFPANLRLNLSISENDPLIGAD